MKFYRYECEIINRQIFKISPLGKLKLIEFELIKETPKGYWISESIKIHEGFPKYFDKIFILKESRKRFAYPTKEDALNNYILRTKKHIKLVENKLNPKKQTLKKAENILKNIKYGKSE